jgi:DNA repair protein RadC
MQQHFFSFESSELQKKPDTSSHCSSVQERLVTYGSEALDSVEHLGLILGSQKQADALLKHFGSLTVLARASVEELVPFVSRSKAFTTSQFASDGRRRAAGGTAIANNR